MREIPGFYYDEEKKKYFKITKDHLQSKNKKPCSSPKSQASVSKNEVASLYQFKNVPYYPPITIAGPFPPCIHNILS